jgi:hypothetical protein
MSTLSTKASQNRKRIVQNETPQELRQRRKAWCEREMERMLIINAPLAKEAVINLLIDELWQRQLIARMLEQGLER